MSRLFTTGSLGQPTEAMKALDGKAVVAFSLNSEKRKSYSFYL